VTDEHGPADDDQHDEDDHFEEEDVKDAEERVRQPLAEFLSEQVKAVTAKLQPIDMGWMTQHNARVQEILKPTLQALSSLKFYPTVVASPKFVNVQLPVFEFPEIGDFQAKISDVFKDLDLQGFQQRMRSGCPPNWQDLEDDVDLWDLIEITEDGLPTAWVPREEVLKELLAASDDATRRQVFCDRRDEILEDCRTALKEVTSAELTEYVDMLNEALTVAEASHLAAAQAFAASIFDTVIRREIKPQKLNGYYGKVKQEIQDRHENANMSELRWGVVFIPAVAVLERFDAPKGDPVPEKFNRHASAHAVGKVQYTETNTVIALALSTSMVREAHEQTVAAGPPSPSGPTTP
jgi:hypothetical protein